MILYHILIIAIVSNGFTLWTPYRIIIVSLATIFVFYRNVKLEKWALIVYSAFFAGHLYSNYYTTANHYFLLSIFTWYLTYKLWFKDTKWNFPLYLLTIIFSAATLQKLISPYFLNGNLYAELFLHGDSTPYIGEILFNNFNEYTNQFQDYYNIRHRTATPHSIHVSNEVVTWIKVMTYIILFIEVIVTISLLFAKHYYKYFIFLAFILGTALLRHEHGFFSILLLISLFDIKLPQLKLHNYYKIAFFFIIIIHILYQQEIIFK